MHTHYKGSPDAGYLAFLTSSSLGAATSNIERLKNTYVWQRITQTNGLPLLILLIVHLTIHVFIRCVGLH